MGMYNPPHPGEIIREYCIESLGLKMADAAKALGISPKKLSALLSGKSGISPETALRLSKVFGRSPEGWLRLQYQYDLWKAEQQTDLTALRRIQADCVKKDFRDQSVILS